VTDLGVAEWERRQGNGRLHDHRGRFGAKCVV
jgi:hypothetical protein